MWLLASCGTCKKRPSFTRNERRSEPSVHQPQNFGSLSTTEVSTRFHPVGPPVLLSGSVATTSVEDRAYAGSAELLPKFDEKQNLREKIGTFIFHSQIAPRFWTLRYAHPYP